MKSILSTSAKNVPIRLFVLPRCTATVIYCAKYKPVFRPRKTDQCNMKSVLFV